MVLLREWSVTLLRLSILKQVVVAGRPERQGQDRPPGDRALAGLCLPLPHGDAHDGAFDWLGRSGEVLFYVGQVLLAGAVAMTMWSGYEFFRDVWRQRRPTSRLIVSFGLISSQLWSGELSATLAGLG